MAATPPACSTTASSQQRISESANPFSLPGHRLQAQPWGPRRRGRSGHCRAGGEERRDLSVSALLRRRHRWRLRVPLQPGSRGHEWIKVVVRSVQHICCCPAMYDTYYKSSKRCNLN